MKTLMIATLATMSLGVSAQTIQCPHMLLEKTGTIIVVPVYKTKVTYFFNNEDKEAFAQLEWNADSGRTSACFNILKETNPYKKLLMPSMRMPELEVELLGSDGKYALQAYPAQGGQFYGNLSFIPVNFKMKSTIEKAIKEKRDLVHMSGEFAFGYEKLTKKIVANIDCSKEVQTGVPALHKKLGEVINQVNAITEAKIEKDQVLDMFMGSCVQMSDSDSEGLGYLSRKVKLVKGKIPVEGTISEWTKEVVASFTDLEISIVSDKE
jgi:hypothetical protein